MATTSSKASNAERGGMRSSGRKPGYDDPATGARRELLAADVLDKAAVLFATQGFAATSLRTLPMLSACNDPRSTTIIRIRTPC